MIFDPLFIAIMVVGMVLGGLTQWYIKSTFKKYSKKPLARPMTGAQVAARTLQKNSLPVVDSSGNVSQTAFGKRPVSIRSVPGKLTDHFDPRSNTVGLSDSVYGADSISAAAVAAHEVGHAVQTAQAYLPIRIRSALAPVASFGSSISIWLIIAGLFLFGGTALGMNLMWLGVALFASAVLFQLVTLPVEFDASRRAMIYLRETGVLTADELPKARKVLTAAALTYVAAALVAVLQLMYWLALARD
ncbi:MAG: zinc metallopeptidase [Coriobacteriia bacterium]|nr:zinc metallopeptidase [Coriobacteriia bacterium]MCL2536811.1 zinc metallopeptidase [Coriobacteriia bacterium]